MSEFTVGEAIRHGLNGPTSRNFVIRLVLWTCALLLFVYGFIGSSMFSGLGDFMTGIVALENDPNNTAAAAAMMAGIFKFYGLIFLVAILAWLIMISSESAFHKNIFFGEDKGFFPLRFGTSELKLMVAHLFVWICLQLAYFAIYLACIIVVLLAVMIGMLIAQISETLAIILGVILGVFVFIAIIGAYLYVFARLAPAGAMTIREDKIRLVEAWTLTKDIAIPMTKSFLLLYFIAFAVILVLYALFGFMLFGSGDLIASLQSLEQTNDPSEAISVMGEYFGQTHIKLFMIITGIILGILSMIFYIVWWGVSNLAVLKKGEPLQT